MVKTILIVEDEARMRELICDYLEEKGYRVIEAENGLEGLRKFEENKIDMILLDIMMPELDGLSVCRALRKKRSKVIIVLITARSEEYDKLLGYEFGADDYITKPLSLKVLVAKVSALFNRAEMTYTNDIGIHEIDGLKVNEISHNVSIHEGDIELSPKEFDLLIYLLNNKNIVLSRETILSNVWGYDYYGDIRTVDTHIKSIRQKIKEKSDLIVTVRGTGYKLEVRV